MADTARSLSLPATGPAAPRPVRVACAGFLTALGAGALEGLARVDDSGAAPLLWRGALYLLVLAVVLRMVHGDRVARALLTVGIGVAGVASLVLEPAARLLSAGSLADPFTALDGHGLLLAAMRAVHLLAVLVAVPAMYIGTARTWFT
ncbi:hypothetical protein [Nocardia harenae]|uniref:hypothetical protein n=1 Tax=Nocardia harenae TaxID=358707 RepID=UPI00082D0C3B|nr:hypothetical protein [Nocardia harenae]